MKKNQQGFSIVELLIAIVIFPLLMIGMVNAYNGARHIYQITRQMNQMYIVLSSCPELDRGLEFNSLSSSTNCYPNNSFPAEDGGTGTISYSPVLTVTNTSALPVADPLQTIPDSKIVEESVNWPAPNGALAPLRVRMLITRNGIGQQ